MYEAIPTVVKRRRRRLDTATPGVSGGATLAHFFVGVDLRQNHKGLLKQLKDKKITIKDGEYIVFMNHSRTMVKMFCNGTEAILHYKKDGRVIDPGVIRLLPKYCNGRELDMDGAIKEHLMDVLARKKG